MQKVAVFFVGNEKMTTFAVRNERIDLNQEKGKRIARTYLIIYYRAIH